MTRERRREERWEPGPAGPGGGRGPVTDRIPLTRPSIGAREKEAVLEALERDVLHGDGAVGRRVESRLQDWLEVEHAFLTTSCTHALETAMLALEVGPGDEVILPSYNFVSAANAVVLRGARPVYAEIREETLNLDPEDVARRITDRTVGIVPVHYAGVACRMDELSELADAHGLWMVEDAAQAIDARYRGRALGTLGDVGCLSFHDTKNLVAGEGGALLTDDPEVAGRVEVIREKGTDRSAFYRGEVDKYSWVARGSSYVLSEVLASLLEVQIDRREEIRDRRGRVWTAYREAMAPLAGEGKLELPTVPDEVTPNYHIFYVLTPDQKARAAVLEALNEAGIGATFHYVPLHRSQFGRRYLRPDQTLEMTESCADRIVRLPLYPQLAERAEELASRTARTIRRALD